MSNLPHSDPMRRAVECLVGNGNSMLYVCTSFQRLFYHDTKHANGIRMLDWKKNRFRVSVQTLPPQFNCVIEKK